jgi:hypothetical protein
VNTNSADTIYHSVLIAHVLVIVAGSASGSICPDPYPHLFEKGYTVVQKIITFRIVATKIIAN